MAGDKKSPHLLARWIRSQKPSRGGECVLERHDDAQKLGTWTWEQLVDAGEVAQGIIGMAQDDADARDQKTVYRVCWMFENVLAAQHLLRISPADEAEPDGSTEAALKLQLRHNEGLVATLVRLVETQAAASERMVNIFAERLAYLEGARGEALEAEREAAQLAGASTQADAVVRVGEKVLALLAHAKADTDDIATLKKVAQHPMVKALADEVTGGGSDAGS